MTDNRVYAMPSVFPADYRGSGLLLHVTSLPTRYGVGDVGPFALAWVDRLAASGQSWWQSLPLGPTGTDGSPYWVRSDSAGNTALIDSSEPVPLHSSEFQSFLESSRDRLDDYAAFGARVLPGGLVSEEFIVAIGDDDIRTLDGLDSAVRPGVDIVIVMAMSGG